MERRTAANREKKDQTAFPGTTNTDRSWCGTAGNRFQGCVRSPGILPAGRTGCLRLANRGNHSQMFTNQPAGKNAVEPTATLHSLINNLKLANPLNY